MLKATIAIIGGGPAAMMLAAHLNPERFSVTLYERNKALGRKFLVAGKGGFNLTHSEPLAAFAERYTPSDVLRPALEYFSNEQLRAWLDNIGVPTFVGSSRKIYPVAGIKPITVLKTITEVLATRNVAIRTEHHWTGWHQDGSLRFTGKPPLSADHTVFALGGGSWKVTGSDGSWLPLFDDRGISTQPFRAANCGYQTAWPATFIEQNEGQPLKNIAIRCGDREQQGEVVLTRLGLEGNAIYALSSEIQAQLAQQQKATIFLDLKPVFTKEEILQRILASRERKTTNTLRRDLKLTPLKMDFLRTFLTKEEYLSPPLLAQRIKQLPLSITAAAPLDEAISTTGGIALDAIKSNFELHQFPRTYCIGEMLDWNAPTGGYLLQACFSMGAYLAHCLNQK